MENTIEIGSIYDNVIDGVVVEKGVKVIDIHPIDNSIIIVENKYGRYLAKREYLVKR